MKINPKYGDRIITIPGAPVLQNLSTASVSQLKVLIYALAEQEASANDYIEATGLSKEEVTDALSFWREKGVFTVAGLKKSSAASVKNKGTSSDADEIFPTDDLNSLSAAERVKRKRALYIAGGMPEYNESEVAKLLRRTSELKDLIDVCNQVLGKILNPYEIRILVALHDFLELGSDYLILLCQHCANSGNRSLHYIEKTCLALTDIGIADYASLDNYFKKIDSEKTTEGLIRKLYGIGIRILSENEQKYIDSWIEMGFSNEMLKKAYDITVDYADSISMRYTNTVLTNWYKNGIKTPEDADNASLKFREENAKKTKKSKGTRTKEKKEGGSFDTEDFFEAALKRSYGEEKSEAEVTDKK